MTNSRLLLTFYGDDFTGSTDVMEVLEWAGVPSLLFLEPPTLELLQMRFPDVRAVGVAGVSRSMSPAQMDTDLPLIVGAPFLRRSVAFSNLFARVDDVTYRLDRHPTMSKHPLTPMNEADLRGHLAQQTSRRIAAVNILVQHSENK